MSALKAGSAQPTLEEVAALAGVSRATVSRVVNGDERVRPGTRQAVTKAIQKLGYSPNRAARSLVTRRSDSIALVIPEPTGRLFGDPFFPRLVRGISEVLTASDIQLVLLAPQSRADEERVGRYLLGGHVDGALLVSMHGDDPLPGTLAAGGIPVVVGGRPQTAAPAVSYVDMDNVNGARAAVRHLLDGGRRVIATITGPLDMTAAADRLQGYRDALAAHGLQPDPDLVAVGDFDTETARQRTDELLDRRADVDAVFAHSDVMAVGVLQALRRRGRRVPADVAVVGFDDSQLAASAEPPLSSVRQTIEEMGREMSRLLLRRIATGDPVGRRLILATELVVRASSGR